MTIFKALKQRVVETKFIERERLGTNVKFHTLLGIKLCTNLCPALIYIYESYNMEPLYDIYIDRNVMTFLKLFILERVEISTKSFCALSREERVGMIQSDGNVP